MHETNTSRRNKIIAIIFGIALLVGIAIAVINIAGSDNSSRQTNQSQNDSAQNANNVTFTAVAGKTVLEQLQEKANVEVEDAGLGPFVAAINGTRSGADDKYWLYYVNGEPASVGAADYTTEGGETIEWKFEKFE